MSGRWRARWDALVAGHDALFVAPWRGALRREARRQDDAFLALVYLSAFGIDDPARYHTLALTPELIESFHRWHRAQGLDRFPDAGVCC